MRSTFLTRHATLAVLLPCGSAQGFRTPAPTEFFGSNIQALIRQGFVQPPAWAA